MSKFKRLKSERLLRLTCTALLAVTAIGTANAADPITIAFVPKVVGLPYFNAMRDGLLHAGKDFGATIVYQGPTTGSVSDQSEIVQSLINKHVSALGVSANSPTALMALAHQAHQQGIVFYSSDSQVSGPDVDFRVEQASDEEIANAVIDILAGEIGSKGDIAFVSGGATATNLNNWIALMKKHLAEKYPNMKLVSVQYTGESINTATQVTSQILSAYPNLKGVVGMNTPTVPGAAQAVLSAGLSGKIAVTGITDPNFIRPYIANGTVKQVVLWNPISLGYLTGWAAMQVLQHKPFQAENDVPGLPDKVKYLPDNKTLVLGKPMIINASNVNKLNF